MNQVFKELVSNRNDAEKYLYTLTDHYPELIQSIQNKQASHMILNCQKHMIDEYFKSGSINEDEHAEYRDKIDIRINGLDYSDLNWDLKKIDTFAVIAPEFSKLGANLIQIVKDQISEVKFAAGQKIYSKDVEVTGVYIIKKGLVEDAFFGDFTSRSGMGSTLSYANIINKNSVALSTLTAVSETQAYFIPRNVIMQLADENSEFEEEMYKHSLLNFMKSSPNSTQSKFDEATIHEIANKSNYRCYQQPNQLINLEFGGYLFSGELRINDDSLGPNINLFEEPCLIRARTDYVNTKKCKILKFTEPIEGDEFIGNDKKSIFRKSLMAGVGVGGGLGKPSFRNSILVTIQQEKDVDKLYNSLAMKKFSSLAPFMNNLNKK